MENLPVKEMKPHTARAVMPKPMYQVVKEIIIRETTYP